MTAKHGDVWRSKCGAMELRCGDYREVLAEVECDAAIADPPYSERTHAGQRHGRREAGRAGSGNWCSTKALPYAALTADDMRALLSWCSRAASGWACIFSDTDGAQVYRRHAAEIGRTAFAPLACVQVGMNVRLAGDGPSNWTTWLGVSRPKSLRAWGTLPGAYCGPPARQEAVVPGGKPLWLMRALVRDYSRPGSLICDPCAGGGTTLLAAATEGRRAIGAELDPETYEKAVVRLSRGYTPQIVFAAGNTSGEQSEIFDK